MLIGELLESPAVLAPAGGSVKVRGKKELIVTVITIIGIIMKADEMISFPLRENKKRNSGIWPRKSSSAGTGGKTMQSLHSSASRRRRRLHRVPGRNRSGPFLKTRDAFSWSSVL